MPGGQYTNLFQQAQALGLGDRWPEVCRMYAEVNQHVRRHRQGDADVEGRRRHGAVPGRQQPDAGRRRSTATRELAFPESVVEFFEGRLGQPPGGFPPELQKRVLRGRKPIDRPARGDAAAGRLRTATRRSWRSKLGRAADRPRRRLATCSTRRSSPTSPRTSAKYSDTSVLPTPVFFYGMEPGEEISVEIEPGKTLIVKFLTVGEPHADGTRTVFFELNGQPREVDGRRPLARPRRCASRPKADPATRKQVAAPMPGLVVARGRRRRRRGAARGRSCSRSRR